jgi:hypothetical protein
MAMTFMREWAHLRTIVRVAVGILKDYADLEEVSKDDMEEILKDIKRVINLLEMNLND